MNKKVEKKEKTDITKSIATKKESPFKKKKE